MAKNQRSVKSGRIKKDAESTATALRARDAQTARPKMMDLNARVIMILFSIHKKLSELNQNQTQFGQIT